DQVGFKNAKMEDIAHKVGFSKASLYSYFRDKEEIAMQIIKLHLENFYKKISSLPEKNISAKEKLGFIKNGYMDFIRKAKNYIIIKSNMDCNDITHKEVIELKTNIYYVLSSILEQGIKEKTFIKSLNIPKSALLLESMLTGISFINSIADQSNDKTLSGFNIEEMTSFAMDFFYMGITNTKQELCK
ncbi:MAG: TetR/AcrR family transcriptional regulator, partial [Candidatus Delongbacteria bacterium]|nr:TetR/AcrR family transcriptional regulator [Candidatus Delongbacteria bacterium]MCG2760425.1 TetR/AcrR family transcriptional regulator [Candidatus Delongbacteria bacterium]